MCFYIKEGYAHNILFHILNSIHRARQNTAFCDFSDIFLYSSYIKSNISKEVMEEVPELHLMVGLNKVYYVYHQECEVLA
jgi:hypothetical protein